MKPYTKDPRNSSSVAAIILYVIAALFGIVASYEFITYVVGYPIPAPGDSLSPMPAIYLGITAALFFGMAAAISSLHRIEIHLRRADPTPIKM